MRFNLFVRLVDPHSESSKFFSRNNNVAVFIDKGVEGINLDHSNSAQFSPGVTLFVRVKLKISLRIVSGFFSESNKLREISELLPGLNRAVSLDADGSVEGLFR